MKTDAVTRMGTPVYKVEVPINLLRGRFGSRRIADPRGPLAEYLKKRVELPACVIVHAGNKLSRIVKICEDGLLLPGDASIIPRPEKKKLVEAGLMTKGFLNL